MGHIAAVAFVVEVVDIVVVAAAEAAVAGHNLEVEVEAEEVPTGFEPADPTVSNCSAVRMKCWHQSTSRRCDAPVDRQARATRPLSPCTLTRADPTKRPFPSGRCVDSDARILLPCYGLFLVRIITARLANHFV